MDRDPWRGLGGVGQPLGLQRVRHDLTTEHTAWIGEGSEKYCCFWHHDCYYWKTGLALDLPPVVSLGPSLFPIPEPFCSVSSGLCQIKDLRGGGAGVLWVGGYSEKL